MFATLAQAIIKIIPTAASNTAPVVAKMLSTIGWKRTEERPSTAAFMSSFVSGYSCVEAREHGADLRLRFLDARARSETPFDEEPTCTTPLAARLVRLVKTLLACIPLQR